MRVIAEPESELEEIVQNVRMILATPRGSVPMDRGLGVLASGLDDPLPAAKAAMTRDVMEAIARYEPRAEPVRVAYTSDDANGRLSVSAVVRIAGEVINV